jgi:hypothetical protein
MFEEWIALPQIFEISNKPRETRMRNLGSEPREVQNQPDRLPAEGRVCSSEMTSKPRLFHLCCLRWPSSHRCHSFGIRSFAAWLDLGVLVIRARSHEPPKWNWPLNIAILSHPPFYNTSKPSFFSFFLISEQSMVPARWCKIRTCPQIIKKLGTCPLTEVHFF